MNERRFNEIPSLFKVTLFDDKKEYVGNVLEERGNWLIISTYFRFREDRDWWLNVVYYGSLLDEVKLFNGHNGYKRERISR